jgi:hypothetical protein
LPYGRSIEFGDVRKMNRRSDPPSRVYLEGMRQTEDFKRAAVDAIMKYWPSATVEISEERKGIPKPDILVEQSGLKIPIEVKTRTEGYFSLIAMRSGRYNVLYTPIRRKNRQRAFGPQVAAMLRDHNMSLFLVNTDVYPQSPSHVDVSEGRLILSDLSTFEQSLDLAYEFLAKRK